MGGKNGQNRMLQLLLQKNPRGLEREGEEGRGLFSPLRLPPTGQKTATAPSAARSLARPLALQGLMIMSGMPGVTGVPFSTRILTTSPATSVCRRLGGVCLFAVVCL